MGAHSWFGFVTSHCVELKSSQIKKTHSLKVPVAWQKPLLQIMKDNESNVSGLHNVFMISNTKLLSFGNNVDSPFAYTHLMTV